MSASSLLAAAPTGPGRARVAARPSCALSPEILAPIGEGIVGCPPLWEPLRAQAERAPVPLVATDGYEVHLVAHPPGARIEPPRPGTTHTLTVATGSLRIRSGGNAGRRAGVRLVPAGATVVLAADDRAVIESAAGETALAVHVRSGAGSPASTPRRGVRP